MRLLSPALLGVAGLLSVAVLPRSTLAQAACTHYAATARAGTQDGSSLANAFTIGDFLHKPPAPGETLCVADGTYTTDWIEMGSGPSGAPGSPITIRALNDGGVFLDGGYTHRVLFLNGASYWTFQGFDVGNSLEEAIAIYGGSHHLTFQRMCAWNAHFPRQDGTQSSPGYNLHTVEIEGTTDSVFEDLCLFGYGRNTYNNYQAGRNTVRRLWTRWDGWADDVGATCPGGHVQQSYNPRFGNNIWDNIISIFSGGLYDRSWRHPDGFPCTSLAAGSNARDAVLQHDQPNHFSGIIDYGYPTNMDIVSTDPAMFSGWHSRWVPNQYQDFFTDGRHITHQDAGPTFSCDTQTVFEDPSPGSDCRLGRWDRFTTLKNPGQGGPSVPGPATNVATCTGTIGNCPNFYTGTPGGAGSQMCYQYQDGTLTSTPLWPWPMDDRIKQALQRSGIGPSLSGSAGPGYAAGTVTSEIVARYGPVPAPCLRGGGGAPPPVAGGGGSVPTNLRLRSIP